MMMSHTRTLRRRYGGAKRRPLEAQSVVEYIIMNPSWMPIDLMRREYISRGRAEKLHAAVESIPHNQPWKNYLAALTAAVTRG